MNDQTTKFPKALEDKLRQRSKIIGMMLNYIFDDGTESDKIEIAKAISSNEMFSDKTILVTEDELWQFAVGIIKNQLDNFRNVKQEVSEETKEENPTDTESVG